MHDAGPRQRDRQAPPRRGLSLHAPPQSVEHFLREPECREHDDGAAQLPVTEPLAAGRSKGARGGRG